MRDPELERINNRIDHLMDDLTILKGLERSGSDVSAFIQSVSEELKRLEWRKRNLGAAIRAHPVPLAQGREFKS